MFYVYAYLDPRYPGHYEFLGFTFKFKPFYIGKGSTGRIYSMNNRNKHFLSTIKLLKRRNTPAIPVFVLVNLSETDAFSLEDDLINELGIRNNGGLLTNQSLGQYSGHAGVNNGMFGKFHSEESKAKMSKSRENIVFSEEWKSKLAIAASKPKSDSMKQALRDYYKREDSWIKEAKRNGTYVHPMSGKTRREESKRYGSDNSSSRPEVKKKMSQSMTIRMNLYRQCRDSNISVSNRLGAQAYKDHLTNIGIVPNEYYQR